MDIDNCELVSYKKLTSVTQISAWYATIMIILIFLALRALTIFRMSLVTLIAVLATPTVALIITYFTLKGLQLRKDDKVARAISATNLGIYVILLLFNRHIYLVILFGVAMIPVFFISFIWFKIVEKNSVNLADIDENIIDLKKINIQGKKLTDESFSEFLTKIGMTSSIDYFYAMHLKGKIEEKRPQIMICYTIAFDEEKVYVFEMNGFNGWRIEHYYILPKQEIQLKEVLVVSDAKRIELIVYESMVLDVSNKLFKNQEKNVELFIKMLD